MKLCLPTTRQGISTKLILAVVLAGMVLAGPFSVVLAQESTTAGVVSEGIGLTAIPPRLGDDGKLRANPGETIQTEVRVRNSTDQTIVINSSVEDFVIGSDGRTPIPVMEQTNSRWSLASWIQIPREAVTIPAKTSQTIPVVIRVPADALPGGRYAMIMHEPTAGSGDAVIPGSAQTGGQAAVQQRVGTIVYLTIAGDIQLNAQLRNIRIPGLSEYGPVPIQFSIENLSDIHLTPSATITIRNMFGTEVEKIPVESQNIFPYSIREFSTQWDRIWGFGRYSARIAATYGDKGQTVAATEYFWVIPYTLILAIIILIMVIIALYIAIRRHLHHRHDVSQQHIELLEDRIRQLEDELHNQ